MSEFKKPIFAIDPGNVESAYVVYFPDTHSIGDMGKIHNKKMRDVLHESRQWNYDFSIEMIASYGMPVGRTVFNTCIWIGRFIEILKPRETTLIYRQDVKQFLCHSNKATDANVRQAIEDLFPPTGGGSNPVKGTKKEPGPLYGCSKDVWQALGVALKRCDQIQQEEAALINAC